MGNQKTVLGSRRQARIYLHIHGKQDRKCEPWARLSKALVLPLRSCQKTSKSSQKPDWANQKMPSSHRPGILPVHSLAHCMGTGAGVDFPWKQNSLNSVPRGVVSSGAAMPISPGHSFLLSMIWQGSEVPRSEIAHPSSHLLDFTITGIYSCTTGILIPLGGILPDLSNVFESTATSR